MQVQNYLAHGTAGCNHIGFTVFELNQRWKDREPVVFLFRTQVPESIARQCAGSRVTAWCWGVSAAQQ